MPYKDPSKRRENDRKYRLEHREQMNAWVREYRKTYRQRPDVKAKEAAYGKEYRRTHPITPTQRARHNAYLREYNRINHTEVLKRYEGYRAKLKLEVLSHYSSNPPKCALCTESNILILDIDHLNGKGSAHRRELKIVVFARWLKSHGFPEGYRVLCRNCNWKEWRIRQRASMMQHVSTTEMAESKVCSSCKLRKSFTEFSLNNGRNSFQGRPYYNWCKVCVNQRTFKHRAKLKLEILAHYSNSSNSSIPHCANCHESDIDVLDIDHIDGGGSQKRKSIEGPHVYLFIKRNHFPSGYRVLCRNCNWLARMNALYQCGSNPSDVTGHAQPSGACPPS